MKKAGSILDKIMQKLGLTKRYNEQKSLLLWKKVVGSRISSKTNPLYAKNGRLVVEVENSAWMNELLFLKPKIIEKLKDGTFMGAFSSKGRLSDIVSNIPVKVILNDKTALLGAVNFALQKIR